MIRACRDCAREGDEREDDPAPGLCPQCYDKRLARLTREFARQRFVSHQQAASWLERALIDTGGETPAAAAQHVRDLLLVLSMQRG